jgi:hypothetical protein
MSIVIGAFIIGLFGFLAVLMCSGKPLNISITVKQDKEKIPDIDAETQRKLEEAQRTQEAYNAFLQVVNETMTGSDHNAGSKSA